MAKPSRLPAAYGLAIASLYSLMVSVSSFKSSGSITKSEPHLGLVGSFCHEAVRCRVVRQTQRTQLSSEHFLEIRVESYITRFFHIKEDFAFVEVNGKKWYQQEDGVQLTVIDGHDGNVVDSKGFRNLILQGVPAQLENYVNGLKDSSIVLVTSKGRLVTEGSWTKVLERLGANKIITLKEKLAFVGFKGSFYPDWVKLEISSDQAKIHQVLPVPIVCKFKL